MDNDLLKYCIDNEFPVDEMTTSDFIKVEKSAGYNSYKISKIFNSIKTDIIKAIKKIEHRNESCKNFRSK